jgi:hypothetical protein
MISSVPDSEIYAGDGKRGDWYRITTCDCFETADFLGIDKSPL